MLWVVAAAAAAAVAASLAAAPGVRGAFGAAIALTMIGIAVIDARHFTIPDQLTGAALVIAVGQALWLRDDGIAPALAELALRAGAMAALFYAIHVGYRAWRGRDGLGLGDVKLAGVAGALLGWSVLPVAVEIAALSALAVVVAIHVWRKRPLRRTTRMPFGLFLAPAIWIGWLIDNTIGPLF